MTTHRQPLSSGGLSLSAAARVSSPAVPQSTLPPPPLPFQRADARRFSPLPHPPRTRTPLLAPRSARAEGLLGTDDEAVPRAEAEELEERLREREDHCAALSFERDQLRSIVEQYNAREVALEQAVAEADAEWRRREALQKSELRARDETISSLRASLEKEHNKGAAAEEHVLAVEREKDAEYKPQIEALLAKVAEAGDAQAEAERNHQLGLRELVQREQDAADLRRRVQQLTAEVASEGLKYAKLCEQHEALQSSRDRLEEEKDRIAVEASAQANLEAEVEDLLRENDELRDDRAKKEALEAFVCDLEEEILVICQERDKCRAEIEELREALAARDAAAQGTNLLSRMGKPFAPETGGAGEGPEEETGGEVPDKGKGKPKKGRPAPRGKAAAAARRSKRKASEPPAEDPPAKRASSRRAAKAVEEPPPAAAPRPRAAGKRTAAVEQAAPLAPAGAAAAAVELLEKKTVMQLRAELATQGLPTTGRKAELIAALRATASTPAASAPTAPASTESPTKTRRKATTPKRAVTREKLKALSAPADAGRRTRSSARARKG